MVFKRVTFCIVIIIDKILQRIKSTNWGKFAQGPAFVALLIFGGFMLGRYTAPVNVKTVTQTTTIETRHELQTITQQVDLTKILQQIKDSSKTIDRTVIREVVTAKDGSKVERETTTSHTDQNTKEQTGATETTKVSTSGTKASDVAKKETTKTVTTTTSPDKWKVGATVGLGWDATNLPNHLVIGGVIERDVSVPLLGKFGVGAWVNSQAQGGLLLLKGF